MRTNPLGTRTVAYAIILPTAEGLVSKHAAWLPITHLGCLQVSSKRLPLQPGHGHHNGPRHTVRKQGWIGNSPRNAPLPRIFVAPPSQPGVRGCSQTF